MQTKQIDIHSKIEDAPLSLELKYKLASIGYSKLKDVFKVQISSLRKRAGISFEEELELYKLVEKHGLEEFWKER